MTNLITDKKAEVRVFQLAAHFMQFSHFIGTKPINPHTDLQKNSHFWNLQGPADPKNCMSWYKRYAKVEHGFQGSDCYSWSNDQSFLGSARTPKVSMSVNRLTPSLFQTNHC